MVIYYLLFFIAIFGGVVSKTNKEIYLATMFLLIFFVFALRDYSVGTDIGNYIVMFNNADNNIDYYLNDFMVFSNFLGDPIFFFYCSVLKMIGLDFRWFIVVSSAIMLWPTFGLYRKYSQGFLISIMSFMTIGLMGMFLSGIRQSLAIAIITISVKYIIELKPIKYYVCVILAMGFHISACVMLPVYIIINSLKNKSPEIIISLWLLVGGVFSSTAYEALGFFELGVRFENYLIAPIKTNPVVVVMYMVIAFIYIIGRKYKIKLDEKTRMNDLMFGLYSIGCAVVIISLQNAMLSRLSYYFMICLPIVLSNAINYLSVKKRMFISVLCIMIEIVFFVYTTPHSFLGISEYKFFWE